MRENEKEMIKYINNKINPFSLSEFGKMIFQFYYNNLILNA